MKKHPLYFTIHGHFYQPPRENPWTGVIENQPSARPFHDWNDRIASECYSPNAASRILSSTGKIADIVNNYDYPKKTAYRIFNKIVEKVVNKNYDNWLAVMNNKDLIYKLIKK